jgi:hypothetical protein
LSARAPSRWQFGYGPVTVAAGPEEPAIELLLATREPVAASTIEGAIEGARASEILSRAPLFWTTVTLGAPRLASDVARLLSEAGLPVRYVASAERPSLALGAPLSRCGVAPLRPGAWKTRAAIPRTGVDRSAGMWFLRDEEGGIGVDRARFGGGAGTRLAVIDDDALEADALGLDAELLVGLDAAPRHGAHGALMVAWASGARRFEGVAPDASRRLYLIPKPGRGVVALPLAIARAAIDGADVIVCATYVEGSTSPMLDDALEVATRLGRSGRGAAVLLPTGRETSSVAGSLSASFSLGLGEPASDPRAICVAPGARGEGWFLWRDRRGRLRPFANRGPAVRWLSPGDDIAYPFSAEGAPPRLFHAESSGASAIAAGALLLVLAASPRLRLDELCAVVDQTLSPMPAELPVEPRSLADPADVLPRTKDADGHDAKHGYGRIHVGRACLVASDPVCAALVAMGEHAAARAYADARPRVYTRAFARWAARALLADRQAAHMLRATLRHLRLVGADEARRRAHGDGAIARQIRLLVRRLATSRLARTARVDAEIAAIDRRLAEAEGDARFESALTTRVAGIFAVRGAPGAGPPDGD